MKMPRKSNSDPYSRGMYCHASAHCSDLRISHYDIADDEDMELCMRRPSIDFTSHHSYMCRAPRSSCQALRHAVSALNRLDDFNCEKIGAGFFSEVFKVTHKTTGRVMVLKMNTSQSNRPNMLREVQLMNRLSHPNILRFMGVCVHEGQLHALTEYINGGSLEQHLINKDEDLSWETRVKLALDAAQGLCYLHSRGVFHRDLTSKNVLMKVQEDGQLTAIVGDFGLAEKIPDVLKDSNRLPTVGSPYWMAPECLRGNWYNEKADVFSFGIILCEIIARVEADPDILPRTSNFGLDYIAFIKMCGDCPPEFLKLAFSCCRIDPESRPNFSEIVDQLTSILMTVRKAQSCGALSNGNCVREGRERSKTSLMVPSSPSFTNFNLYVPRSKSEERISVQMSPSEKARCHKFTAKGKLRHVVVPLTLQHIGEVMSLGDPHYRPGASNPFADLSQFRDGRKIVCSNKELFSSCFELPSPSAGMTPPASPDYDLNLHHSGNKKLCLQIKSSSSAPNSPKLLKRALIRMNSCQFERYASEKNTLQGNGPKTRSNYETACDAHTYQMPCRIPRSPPVLPNSNPLVFPKLSCQSNEDCAFYDSGVLSLQSDCDDGDHVSRQSQPSPILVNHNHELLWNGCHQNYSGETNGDAIISSCHYDVICDPRANKRPPSCYSDDSGIALNSSVSSVNGIKHPDRKYTSMDKENLLSNVNINHDSVSVSNKNQSLVWTGSPQYKDMPRSSLSGKSS